MTTMAESPEAESRIVDLDPNEVSAVDMPAIGEPHFVMKGMQIKKANEPKDDMSREELEAAREARSKTFGIEVLEKGSHLTYPSDYPTTLDEYGDPVNLKYPTDTPERAQNARTRFKQFADAYKKDSSKAVVHERIVRAELKHGIEPGYDSDDPLDKLLPSDLKDQLAKACDEEDIVDKKVKTVKKLNTEQVPRPVMKAVHKRLKQAIEHVGELHDVAKSLKIAEGGTEKAAPQVLIDMTKSLASEIRSLQPSDSMFVTKRAVASSMLSLQDVAKRMEDVEKANAVSYLMRDRYVSVTDSISEYLTTYVDGIEHDDDGPMLIPSGLDSTVDKTAGALEEMVEEYEVETDESEETPVEEVPTSKALTTMMESVVSRIEKVAAGLTKKEKTMTEETAPTEAPTTEPAATETPTETPTEEAPATAPATMPVEKDEVIKAIEALSTKVDKRFEDVEKTIEDIRGVAKSADEKVEKALRVRSDANGGGPAETTKVTTEKGKKKDDGDFSSLLGIPKAAQGETE